MTPEIRLRDVIEEDLPLFFQHQRDPEAVQMAAFQSRDWEAFITHWTKVLGDPSCITQAVLFNGVLAGNVVCWGDPDDRKVGYWIGRQCWGKGVATAALSLFLKRVKERPLYAYVAKHNKASLRVLQKNGFVVVGETNGSVTESGDAVDELIMRLDDGRADSRIKL